MAWTNGDFATAATATIAFIALIRPDFSRIARRWTSSLDVHPAGRIEIGLSNFGPTVGLELTLRARQQDQFVTGMRVTVVRIADQLRHGFEWAVFRPAFGLQPQSPQNLQIASAFLLPETEARRVSVQCHDRDSADRIRDYLIRVQQLWLAFLQERQVLLRDVPPGQIRAFYNEFYQQKMAPLAAQYAEIDRLFYWNQGAYRLSLEITTNRPTRIFTFDWGFRLSAEDSHSLRLNQLASMMVMCNVPEIVFNFAYPRYE